MDTEALQEMTDQELEALIDSLGTWDATAQSAKREIRRRRIEAGAAQLATRKAAVEQMSDDDIRVSIADYQTRNSSGPLVAPAMSDLQVLKDEHNRRWAERNL